MGMTLTEKILARASGRDSVKPGDIISGKIDLAIMQELSATAVYKEIKGLTDRLWDTDRVVVGIDKFLPPSAPWKAQTVREANQFVKEYRIKNFYQGITHVVIS